MEGGCFLKLIVFTAHYPFLPGEEFFDAEINILSKHFEGITIVTGERDINKKCKSTPYNVNTVIVNIKYDFLLCIFSAFKSMFSLKTLNEIAYAKNVLKKKINFGMFKMLFIYNAVSERVTRWIRRNMNKNEGGVLYTYWLGPTAYALSELKRKGYMFKAISRAHGGDAFIDRGYQPYRNIVYQYLNEIHFVSDAGRKQYQRKVVLPNNTSRAVLYTSRLGTLKPVETLNPFDVDSKLFHIVTCSSVIPLKRLDIVIDALKELNEHKIKWTHFGDGVMKKNIMQLAEEKLDNKRVEIEFTGQVPNESIHAFYQKVQVDVFVNVSDYEGVPVSIMEAMSYGIPIIARDVGGNKEIVYSGVNGKLLPKTINPIELTNALMDYKYMKYEDKIAYRKASYKIWQENYNAVDNYFKFANHIKSHFS